MTRVQRQQNETNCLHLVAGIRLRLTGIAPANKVQHGGQTESLWDHNYERRSLGVNVKPSSPGSGERKAIPDSHYTIKMSSASELATLWVCKLFQ